MSVHQSQFADTQRQIAVRSGLRFIYQQAARAVHGLHRKILVIDHRGIHILPVMIPVSGRLPKLSVQQNGRRNLLISFSVMQLSPIIDQDILQDHSLRQEERKSRAFLHEREQPHFLSDPAVIPLLRFLNPVQMLLKLFLVGIGRSIDTGEHLILLAPSPISARKARELKRLYIARMRQMRTRTQIHEVSLFIEADNRILRKVFNQFHLVRLVSLLHQSDGFFPGQGKALQTIALLHNLLHFLLNRSKIIAGYGLCKIKIVIKTIFNGRPNGQFCIRIQPFYGLRQNMGRGMAENLRTLAVEFRFASASVLQYDIHLTFSPFFS